MLTVHHLKKLFNIQLLFENVSFSLNPGDRIGLIGANGCGKTTLLRILAGEEQASAGTISHAPDLRIGYLPQHNFESKGGGVESELTVGEIIGQVCGNPAILDQELAETAALLTDTGGDPEKRTQIEFQYDDLLRRIQSAETGRSASILAGLGLNAIDPVLPASRLSGGQKTRLGLALVLLADPHLLLLDEPTNHLDIGMLEWLEDWLKACSYGMLIVSHDRTFLDHTVTQILEMDSSRHVVHNYPGNYSAYLEQKQTEYEKQWSAFKDQQQEIRQMKQDIVRTKAQAAFTERQASSIRIGGPDMKIKGYKCYQQGIAIKVARKAKAREKKLERYLEDEERVEKPQSSWQMHIGFTETPHLGRSVIQMADLAVGYDPARPLLKDLRLDIRSGRRIVMTGPNGSGKTTLLRTLAGQLAPLGGWFQAGPSVHIGYMTQDQSELNPSSSAVDSILPFFKNQTEARSFLAYFLFTGEEPLKPIEFLSHGQRARLMLARLVAQQCNCLFLDEPINHLDIPSRTQFEGALGQFDGAILAVVHDRYFIDRFADEIWWVEDGKVSVQVLK